MKKKKLIIGIIFGVLLVAGVTYAILTWTSSKINIGLSSGCFDIDYTKGGDIVGSLKPIVAYDYVGKKEIVDGMGLSYVNIGIKSTCNIEGSGTIYLNVSELSDVFKSKNNDGYPLRYWILKNTSTESNISIDTLKGQSFDLLKAGAITTTGRIDLFTEKLSNKILNKYLIVIFINNNYVSNDMMGATFNATIGAEAEQLAPVVSGSSESTIKRLVLSKSNSTPNFSGVYRAPDNEVYSSEDDLGTSYYFRGAPSNNYVKFANKYWRIVRINGDGSIRMIYAGTSAHPNGYDDKNTNDLIIGKSAFNSSSDDNAYVGYMYGTPGSSTYEATHANTNDSEIKKMLDAWYDANLASYEQYIADAIYCNDRSLKEGTGIGTTETTYGIRSRINTAPSFKCPNQNDKFTKSTSIGNGKLTRMIGLLTTDEFNFAGGVTGVPGPSIVNDKYYLFASNNYHYWFMTPNHSYNYNGTSYVMIGVMTNSGYYMTKESNATDIGVRPVISLKSSAISGGIGTMDDPFVVG